MTGSASALSISCAQLVAFEAHACSETPEGSEAPGTPLGESVSGAVAAAESNSPPSPVRTASPVLWDRLPSSHSRSPFNEPRHALAGAHHDMRMHLRSPSSFAACKRCACADAAVQPALGRASAPAPLPDSPEAQQLSKLRHVAYVRDELAVSEVCVTLSDGLTRGSARIDDATWRLAWRDAAEGACCGVDNEPRRASHPINRLHCDAE